MGPEAISDLIKCFINKQRLTCGSHMSGTVLDNVLDNVDIINKRNSENHLN